MKNPYLIEACVDNLQDALKAEKGGAHRIELCDKLELEGLTPDFTLIKNVQNSVKIPLRVMIRPRQGDFFYTDDEVVEMIDAISKCRYLGVEGVVLGATTSSTKKLDMELIEELCEIAYPLKVTIHKAIDSCTNPVREIAQLKKIKNVDAVLSSGQASTAAEGQQMLKTMHEAAGQNLTVIGAGKITKNQVKSLHANMNLRAYHGRKIVE